MSMKHGINLDNLNTSADPRQDFYRYAAGGWKERHPLKPEEASNGIFKLLDDEARENTRRIFQSLAEDPDSKVRGTIAQKISDLYSQAMDMDRRNREGSAPIQPMIERIERTTRENLSETMAWLALGIDNAFINLAMGGDSNYPFLMSDGMTLYYASDGEGSLGGLDIFISRRDGTSFLQPTNLGFPYNSPANDYLLAIDEVTGAGWWATDRNAIPGKVTVYVFVPQELRINYPVDDPELADRARVTSIAATQQKDKDYSAIRNAIASIDTRPQKPRTSFNFGLPGGRVAHTFADFHNPESQALMNRYLTGCRELADTKARLARMRASYGKGDTSLSADILDTEHEITDIRARLADIANQIAKAEQ